MAVFKFSTTASTSQNRPVSEHHSNVHQRPAHDVPEQLQPRGTTNWDAGLRRVITETDGDPDGTPPADRPDLVVFLTERNPNRWAGGGTGVEEGFYSAMEPAANTANQLKANSHMFAIGVGQA